MNIMVDKKVVGVVVAKGHGGERKKEETAVVLRCRGRTN
jgi:hypothetical protein